MTAGADLEVHIRALPLQLWARSQQAHDELFRELALAEIGRLTETSDVPKRLADLIDHLQQGYAGFTAANEQLLAESHARGEVAIDLTYRLPSTAVDGVIALDGMLDEADEMCRSEGMLLTLAMPDDVLRFRRWFLYEFLRQADGLPPRPFAEVEAD